MKAKQRLYIAAFTIFTALFSARGSAAGHGVGNGGDYLALIFVQKGYEILNYLQKAPYAEIASLGVSQTHFEKTLNETRVEIVSDQLLDVYGAPVDAIAHNDDPANPGGALIQVMRFRFNVLLMKRDRSVAYRFVFHEYLRIMGINDENYRVSVNLNYVNIVSFEHLASGYLSGSETRKNTTLSSKYYNLPIDCDLFDKGLRLEGNNFRMKLSHGCIQKQEETRLKVSYTSKTRYRLRIYEESVYPTDHFCEMSLPGQIELLKRDLNEVVISAYCIRSNHDRGYTHAVYVSLAPESGE